MTTSSNQFQHYVQFLTKNFLTENNASMNLGGGNLSSLPISYKFGGDKFTEPTAWTQRSGAVSLKPDQSFYTGNAFTIDVDLRSQRRTTNIVVRIKEKGNFNLDINWDMIVEARLTAAFPGSLNGNTGYTPDDIYFFRRAAKDIYYVNLPRNVSYRYYRIKLFRDPNISGSLDITDIFVGDSVDIDRPPAQGLEHQSEDLSTSFTADSGRQYFQVKAIKQAVRALSFPLLEKWQVSALKIWSDEVGLTEPFWAILDPAGHWDGPSYGASFGIYRLAEMPIFRHEFNCYWSASLVLSEAL